MIRPKDILPVTISFFIVAYGLIRIVNIYNSDTHDYSYAYLFIVAIIYLFATLYVVLSDTRYVYRVSLIVKLVGNIVLFVISLLLINSLQYLIDPNSLKEGILVVSLWLIIGVLMSLNVQTFITVVSIINAITKHLSKKRTTNVI